MQIAKRLLKALFIAIPCIVQMKAIAIAILPEMLFSACFIPNDEYSLNQGDLALAMIFPDHLVKVGDSVCDQEIFEIDNANRILVKLEITGDEIQETIYNCWPKENDTNLESNTILFNLSLPTGKTNFKVELFLYQENEAYLEAFQENQQMEIEEGDNGYLDFNFSQPLVSGTVSGTILFKNAFQEIKKVAPLFLYDRGADLLCPPCVFKLEQETSSYAYSCSHIPRLDHPFYLSIDFQDQSSVEKLCDISKIQNNSEVTCNLTIP